MTLERLLDVSSKLAHSDSYASLNVCFCSLLHTWVFSSSSYKKKMKRALKSGDFTIIIWFSSLISAEYDETQHKLDFYLTKFPHDALFLLSLLLFYSVTLAVVFTLAAGVYWIPQLHRIHTKYHRLSVDKFANFIIISMQIGITFASIQAYGMRHSSMAFSLSPPPPFRLFFRRMHKKCCSLPIIS